MADAKDKPGTSRTKLVARVRERYKTMYEADRENREEAMKDLKFVHIPGEQWDATLKRERGDRPAYEFNKTRVSVKRVVNEMRANRPQGKVRGVEDDDKDTAEVYEGLCRNIWNTSDGDTVIDYAAEYQVAAGMGAWRVVTKWAHADAFEQDISIEPIRNPFSLFCDPAAVDPLKRDARDWILTDRISNEAYEARWPKAEKCDFESDTQFDDDDYWSDGEFVRIAEYWWKEPYTKTIALLATGQTVDLATVQVADIAPGQRGVVTETGVVPIVRERESRCERVKMAIVSGDAVLEGPNEWAGAEFPFVMVYGDHVVVDGKPKWFGLVRFAKDAQRRYNVTATAIAETIAMAPLAKFWATPVQAKGHLATWAESHRKNFPVNLFNVDEKNPGPPQRIGGAEVPVALMQENAIASDEIKATMGIFDASLGNQGNETSGRAIRARQAQAEIVNFNFPDNLAKGVRRTWEILVDLIPHVFDTERSVRILGVDGAEKFRKVNSFQVGPNGERVPVLDMKRGRYDVTVTVGPSFATKREEAAQVYSELASQNPLLMMSAGDIIMKATDLPYAEQVGERLKAVIASQNPALAKLFEQEGQDAPLPPAVMQKLAQAEQMMGMVQQQSQLVQNAAAEIEGKRAEVDSAVAKLEAQRVTFEAEVKKALADLTVREAKFTVEQVQSDAAASVAAGAESANGERDRLTAEVTNALAVIEQRAEQFMAAAVQAMAQIQAAKLEEPPEPPKRAMVRMRRVNGELVGELVDDSGRAQQARVRRVNGELVGTLEDVPHGVMQ